MEGETEKRTDEDELGWHRNLTGQRSEREEEKEEANKGEKTHEGQKDISAAVRRCGKVPGQPGNRRTTRRRK